MFENRNLLNSNATVFINKPIESKEDDIVGLDTQLDSIKKAIKNGANIIGVVADYGSGKSSLTELLSLDKSMFLTPIKINMWDCLEDMPIDTDTRKSVSTLTKSFLYQLASGQQNNNRLSNHVNKRLSKNYGVLSFSLTSRKFWVWFAGAVIIYSTSLVIEKLSSTQVIESLISYLKWNPQIANIKYMSPFFLVASIFMLIFSIRNTSFAFSLWDSQGKREPEINDVFEIYRDIIAKLRKKCKFAKKQPIFIDDLDRIADKEIVVSFLREIYRYNNLISKNYKDKFVFIVSIKPESMLKDYREKSIDGEKMVEEIKVEKSVYSKIFDYVISLKPIHNEDYNIVLLRLLDNNSENKQDIYKLLGIKKSCDLPSEFSWITRGENLTLRDLKQRLNQAVMLYQLLKSSELMGENYSVDFKKCAAVSYLEDAYPKEYYELIKNESQFAKIVNGVYVLKNDNNKSNDIKQREIVQNIKNSFTDITDIHFYNEVALMLINGIIDNDFKMYFYNYPQGSYIKSMDEKELSNLILLPHEHDIPNDIGEIVERVLDLNGDKVVLQSYKTCIDLGLPLPKIIFENENLFKIALDKWFKQTLVLMTNQIKWSSQNIEISRNIIEKINTYNFDSKKDLYNEYCKIILQQLQELGVEDIYKTRISLIEVLGDEIKCFKNLFLSQAMPIVSKKEIQSIGTIDIKLDVINASIVDNESLDYLAKEINQDVLNQKNYETALNIYVACCASIEHTEIYLKLLDFMECNNKVDDSFFAIISQCLKGNSEDPQILCKYLNSLDINAVSDFYLKNIDSLQIKSGLSDQVLEKLKELDLYTTYLLCRINDDDLDKVTFEDDKVNKHIIDVASEINSIDSSNILRLRKHILKKHIEVIDNYSNLFYDDFPLIEFDELNSFNDFTRAISYINGDKVTASNCSFIPNFANASQRSGDECYAIFQMFNSEYEVGITDEEAINSIFKALNFNIVKFKEMNDKQKQEVIDITSKSLILSLPLECIDLMKTVGCLIESLELIVYSEGLNKRIIDWSEYIDLINEVNIPTDRTIEILSGVTTEWALNENITNKLAEKELWINYIIGKTLWENYFDFDKMKIDPDIYLDVFLNCDLIYEIMSDNDEFMIYIITNHKYGNLPKNRLKRLYRMPQTIDLVKYIFENCSDDEKKEYIGSFHSLSTEEDSKNFQRFICEDINIMLIDTAELYWHLWHKFWNTSEKGLFTRKRNEMFPINTSH